MINPAYLAGVIDSDGSISVSKRNVKRKNPSYCIMFQLTWKETNKSLDFFHQLITQYGGSFFNYDGKYAGRYKNPSTLYKYCLTDKNLKPMLEDVLPFLILKKEQAEIALKVREIIEQNNEDKFEVLYDLYLANRQLNTKNGKSKLW